MARPRVTYPKSVKRASARHSGILGREVTKFKKVLKNGRRNGRGSTFWPFFGRFWGYIACRGVYLYMCVVLRWVCCVVLGVLLLLGVCCVGCVVVSPSAEVVGRGAVNDRG